MKTLLFVLFAIWMVVQTARSQEATVLEVENSVQFAKGEKGVWVQAQQDDSLAASDRIRTRQRSRATLRLTDLYTLRMEQLTTIEISAALLSGQPAQLHLLNGAGFIFSREPHSEIGIKTPAANGALRGTQLFVRVFDNGKTFFQVVEGIVEMTNPQGRLVLQSGQAAEAPPGRAPQRTAAIAAKNILQWALYYPAILDPAELRLAAADQRAAAASLAAYQTGDVLGALANYPPTYRPKAAAAQLYQAGVLLAVGRVEESTKILTAIPSAHPARRALERLIAAAQFREQPAWPRESIGTAAEAMAESYYQQSQSKLEDSRSAAQRAVALAPQNGFAWTRLAELEFCFGRTEASAQALRQALSLAPRHAQAHALQGFVLSAQNQIKAARASFDEAITLDGALGNAWLGRGLTKIKRGEAEDGRRDLQSAATVEPLTSQFHSYLGKALSHQGLREEATKDLALAKQLDQHDPTPWLYSALDKAQHNQLNPAISDLEKSIRLNDNRRVFRSRFLLDQDRAVRRANLAKIYQNNGMPEVAVREATRAVENDYTNASAHLFLSNAFDALRDPKRIELRYETPWFNELLLANLFSPVGGGPLSQFVSQQEYAKLLEADGLGGTITHEWRNAEELKATEQQSTASLFGTHRNVSFGLDTYYYETDGGMRPNADAWRQEVYGQLKWQATSHDILYFLGKWQEQKSGDNFRTYDDLPLSPGLRFHEKQEPGLALAGWNHQWAPGMHTLLLGGRLSASQRLSDPVSNQLLVRRDTTAFHPGFVQLSPEGFEQYTDPQLQAALELPPDGNAPVALDPLDSQTVSYSQALRHGISSYLGTGEILGVNTAGFTFDTQRDFAIGTAEIQQIFAADHHTLLAGVRYQEGDFETTSMLSVIRPTFAGAFTSPAVAQQLTSHFERLSVYGYDYLKPTRWLTLTGGLAWDRIEHPDNFRNPPVNALQQEDERLSGKFGFTLAPSRWVTLRGAYTEGMGGVTFDESVRLEPVQISGFNQAYRTVISESIAGSVETPLIRTGGLSLEGQLPTHTWWNVGLNAIEQDVDRTLGVFDGYDITLFPISPAYFPSGTRQELDYQEASLSASLNQLIGRGFSVGAGYGVTRSELRTHFTEFPTLLVPLADVTDEATLRQLRLFAHWNSPTGLFARLEANWFSQELIDDPQRTALSGIHREGEDFWQCNAMLGYRFHRSTCEISAGLINIAGHNYHLSPLTPHPDMERGQTVVLRCRLSF